MEKKIQVKKIIDENTPLLVIAGPIFIEMLLNITVNNIDTLMLNYYDKMAATATGSVFLVLRFFIFF